MRVHYIVRDLAAAVLMFAAGHSSGADLGVGLAGLATMPTVQYATYGDVPSHDGRTLATTANSSAVDSDEIVGSNAVLSESTADADQGDCDCGDGCCGGDDGSRLLGVIVRSDRCFVNFISPMTQPGFFEDPRTLTEARPIFAHHNLPGALGGGDVQFIATQVRAALTDRLSVIAVKGGFLTAGADGPHDDGWVDLTAGVKYNLWSDVDSQRLLSAGMTFELPIGSHRALQGNGDGEFNLFLTGGAEFWGDCHWISATGLRLPTDTADRSQSWYWLNHFDRKISCRTYAFVEFDWHHWIRSGHGGFGLTGIEGLDLYNFGTTGVAGNDIVTGAFGLKFRPSDTVEIGVAFEFPLTERRDIMENRITADWILRF